MKNATHLFFLFVLAFPAGGLAEENQIVLGSAIPPDLASGKFLNFVYTEAFRRLGMTFTYRHLPAQRSSFLSDSGEIDGELSRIYIYSEMHPDVIRVEEPPWNSGFLAVAAGPSIRLEG